MKKKIKPINIEVSEKVEQLALEKFNPDYHYYPFERKGQIRQNGLEVSWEKRVKYGQVEVDTYTSRYDMNAKAHTFWNDLIDDVKIELSVKQKKTIDRAEKPSITYTHGGWTETHAYIENIPKEKIDYVINKIVYKLFEHIEGYLQPEKYR